MTYAVGVDYGTLSGRAVVVRVGDGAELGSAVHAYRHGVIERTLPATGETLPPDWALQDPEDYLDVLRTAVPEAVAAAGIDPSAVIGIGIDVTSCTVLPVLRDGTPLCRLRPGSRHAYVKLWKHHAAQAQADRMTEIAQRRGEPWLGRYGGRISSEWLLPKALQVLDEDPATWAATERWIEAADWIVWQLCGRETRSAGTAGYKGIFQDGAYPSRGYLTALNPAFAAITSKIDGPVAPLGATAGNLTKNAAEMTGLPEGIPVAVGNIDAHVTNAAAKALDPGQLLAIMGTSTCHVINSPEISEIPGMCGVVDGGVIDGLYGYEAGQSGVGDIFHWYVTTTGQTHEQLTEKAARQPVGAHGLVALDWLSGNRSVLVDHHLSGLIVGLTLATEPHEIYRALIESTAFGARKIVESYEKGGIPVTEFIVAGGLKRNDLVMRVYADVLNRPISVAPSEQAPALGSAIHAAVAAGAYPGVREAAAVMGRLEKDVYHPDPANTAVYDQLYAEYDRLHEQFGVLDTMSHRLRRIRDAALSQEVP
ncbi:ribulokinase [Actinoplanes sp. NPDC051851]|uniref:ribulokinase n=1 Tax=Actinoplanes sp. NPDC051851 TaxID=3154753 RepID=UPI003422A5FB